MSQSPRAFIRKERSRPVGEAVLSVSRPALFLLAYFLLIVTLTPFADRSGAAMLQTFESGSAVNRIAYPLLLLVVLGAVWDLRQNLVRTLLTSAAVPFLLWTGLTVITSSEPELSLRRVGLFVIHLVLTCLVLGLPRNERQLQWLYSASCLVVLVLCYGGVALLPQLSIHQLTDAIETDLAGNWRGVFEHKNSAGCVMAVFVMIGLYLARSYNQVIGWGIAAASAVFLVFSHSKSSIILLPTALALVALMERFRTRTQKALVVFPMLVAFNLMAVAVSYPGPVRSTLQSLLPDVTFTGRTDLWAFSLLAVKERPVVGHGPGAFWRTSTTMYKDREAAEPEDTSGWAAELGTDSHNSYMDVAVASGIPGMLLLILWVVVAPFGDYCRAIGEPRNRDLTRLYARIWVFSIYLGCLESLASAQNPAWFLALQAIFGLTLLAERRVK